MQEGDAVVEARDVAQEEARHQGAASHSNRWPRAASEMATLYVCSIPGSGET